ncbi:MAG: hypothetical protein WCK58_02210, partial [Chloroflexota bacterium]
SGVCSTCHTTKAWKPTSFNHDTDTSFKLTNAHLGPACAKCHTSGVIGAISTACSSCHTKPTTHGTAMSGVCSTCHTTKAWKPTSFSHSSTSFPLTNAHIGPACIKCHTSGVFGSISTVCSSCHTKPTSHDAAYAGVCSACHTTKAWLPADFDHTKAAFQLTGAHMSVSCAKCHVGGVYAGTPTACSSCHTKPASHDAAYAGVCSTCHTTNAWLPASFDHTKAAFQLTGAHVSVSCAKCHVGGVYKGTPAVCASCHTAPTSHSTAYKSGCATCHTTTAWKPATFTVTHTFPKTHQGAGGVCATCHATAWSSYSCAKCHANTTMTSKHAGVSGFTLTTCAQCHPAGRVP